MVMEMQIRMVMEMQIFHSYTSFKLIDTLLFAQWHVVCLRIRVLPVFAPASSYHLDETLLFLIKLTLSGTSNVPPQTASKQH